MTDDLSRQDATIPDSEYTLTIKDAAALYRARRTSPNAAHHSAILRTADISFPGRIDTRFGGENI